MVILLGNLLQLTLELSHRPLRGDAMRTGSAGGENLIRRARTVAPTHPVTVAPFITLVTQLWSRHFARLFSLWKNGSKCLFYIVLSKFGQYLI